MVVDYTDDELRYDDVHWPSQPKWLLKFEILTIQGDVGHPLAWATIL